MTNPQGPPNDPSAWGRPGNQGPIGNPHQPTERFNTGQPQGGPPQQPHTVPGQVPDQTERIGAARGGSQPPGYPPPPMPPAPPTERLAGPQEEPGKPNKKRSLGTKLSIFLILIIVVSLAVVGLIVAELIVRDRATNKIAEAAACVTQDKATAKFGVAPLVLWQLATKHFTNISVETAGNQIKNAKGMKLQLNIKDVQLKDTPDSKGTVGSINATLTWTTEGIKESIQTHLSGLAKFVTNTVLTHPNDGTVELKGLLDDIVAKPVVSGGGIELQIVNFNALGFSLPKESVQSTLDGYTSDLTKNYPLGVRADSVEVTSDAVVAHFSSQNANIPADKTQDPCFANL